MVLGGLVPTIEEARMTKVTPSDEQIIIPLTNPHPCTQLMGFELQKVTVISPYGKASIR